MSSLLVGRLSARSSWCRPPGHKSRTVPQRRQCGLFRLFHPGIERGRAMAAWTLLFEPGPALILLIALLVPQTLAAPVNEQETTDMEYYPIADSTGCYYNFQHYDEGDRIITNEPCLNCTCHNRMLMCYLRVCPFTKAIGQDCKVEKRPDQCCPVITCPEVPVQLLTSTTQSSTEVGHPDAYGCSIEGLFYSDGARVPSDPSKPCELCYCIRNKTACVMQECTLKVEGCKPVYQEGVCCPVRYNCEHPDYNLLETTTARKLITTTAPPTTTLPGPIDCVYNNEVYADGALVIKDKPCERCYCMRGDIVCAVQECNPTPLDKVNCTALPAKEGQCCPDTYDCDHMVEEEITTGGYLYTTPSITLEETTPEKAQQPVQEENEITPQGEFTTLPPTKEGEILHEPVTVLPDESQKAHPEIPEQEDHEEPVKGGFTPMFDDRIGVTEGPETAKPLPEDQVTKQPEVVLTTVKEQPSVTESPEEEVNEIPEEHEIATAGPPDYGQIPEQDETAYPAHPFKEHEPEQVTEAGSGAGEAPKEETQKPEDIPQITTEGKAEESITTEIPQKPERPSPTSEQPKEGKVTEQPQLTERPSEESKPPHETEKPELPEEPQHVPIEGEEEEFPEEHLTEPGTESKATEAPQEHVPVQSEESSTEHPQIIGHVTEMAPEIGTGLPHEVPTQLPEEGKVTETLPEQTTLGISEEGKATESPVSEGTLEEVTKHPSGHVPKKELEAGESTEIPQEEITEGTGLPQEASTPKHVPGGETTEIPPENVTQGQIPESESTEHATTKPVTESKRTEMPPEQITEGAPAEEGKGTELPKLGEEVPKETPEQATEKHLAEEGKSTELPQAQMTEGPSGEGKPTELPSQHPTLPETELEKETEKPESSKGTELPPESESGKTTEIPQEGAELPSEHLSTPPTEEGKATELPQEHVTQPAIEQGKETEGPQEGKATELPPKHATQPAIEQGKETKAPQGGEGTELPIEHGTQPSVEEGKETEKPQEEKGTELTPEHVTQSVIEEKETEKPQVGKGTELPVEHATQPTIEEGKQTVQPQDEIEESKKPQGTEVPPEHVTKPEVSGETEVPPEHITQSAIEEGKGTELPESQVTEEGKITETPQEHATLKPEKPEETTESKVEQITEHVEEPTLIEGEVPAQHPIEEGEEEVPADHETERPDAHLPVETTATPQVTEEDRIATSEPSAEGETEKSQESATTLIQPEGQSEESITEAGVHTTEAIVKETQVPIVTEQIPAEKGEATTPKSLPEDQVTQLPDVTMPEKEKTQEPSEEHVTEAEQQVTEGEIKEPQTEKSAMGEERTTELPEQVTETASKPTEEHAKQKPEESSTPTGEIITTEQFEGETTVRPSYPSRVPEEGEEEEHGIPGEGSCLVDGQTYKNNSNVPPINHCQISCKCVSSILQCESVTCTPPPSNLQHCMPVYQGPDSCCPTYSCTVPGVTSMESDSHKMETTTKEISTEEPATIGVTLVIPSEEGTLRPESTTALGREETEAPAYIFPIDRVPSYRPQDVSPESVSEEVPHPQVTETEPPTTKPAEHIPEQPEEPSEVTTESGVEKATIPVVQEEVTELPSKPEIGQTTEKQLETKSSTELGTTEIPKEETTRPSAVEAETEHIPEISVTTEHPAGVVHDDVQSEVDEGENEIEDHTVHEPPAAPQETQPSSAFTPEGPVPTTEKIPEVDTARVPVKSETEKPEGTTEVPLETPSIGDRVKEVTTESGKEQPSEHVTEPVGESITTEEGGVVHVTVETATEGIQEAVVPEVTTSSEGTKAVATEGAQEEVTQLPTEISAPEEDANKLTTERSKPETPEITTAPEHVTEAKVLVEGVTEVPEESTTEGVKPTSPTEKTKEIEEAVTERMKEKPEVTTLPQVPPSKETKPEIPQFDETGAYPHEEEEQKPGEHITETPQEITTSEKGTESAKTPETEIQEGITEPSSTAKLPESISHVTEPVTEGQPEITEIPHKEEQAPSEVGGTPAAPEMTTTRSKQPSLSEEGAITTEGIPEEETVPSVQTTPSYVPRQPVESSTGIPEPEEPAHTTTGYKPEGEEQPAAIEKEDEAVAQTTPSYVPEKIPVEGASTRIPEKEGEEKVYTTPGYTSAPETVPEEEEEEKEGEPAVTTPGYVPESITSAETTPREQEKESEPSATTPGYVPEGITTEHIPEVSEKEGEPAAQTTVKPEHVPAITERAGEPSVETTAHYEPESVTKAAPEGQLPTETEEVITEGIVPQDTSAPALPSVTEKPEEITEKAPVTEGGVPPQEEQVTEGATPPKEEQVTEGVISPQEQITEGAIPPKEQDQVPGESVTTVKSLEEEVPTTLSPSGVQKLPEEERPGIPGEGEVLEPTKPEESTTIGQEKKPEEAFTSPPLAETTELPQINASTELFTSGPSEEPTTKKSIPGELSTSAPSGVFTSSTTLPPTHEIPEEDYHQEPEDYEEEQSAFGPGTCRYGGKVYVSAQQIPRDDPCDFCFCFRSDIICLQQSCPPPIPHCHEEPIRGFCCPRYECPVSMATAVNVTTTTTTTTTTLPPHFLSHAYKGRAHRTGCQINNKAYHVGEEIKSASGPCLHCKCGGNGQMKCDPKACSPEPMLRQMIAAAEARRRR